MPGSLVDHLLFQVSPEHVQATAVFGFHDLMDVLDNCAVHGVMLHSDIVLGVL